MQDKNAALKAAGAIVPESFEGFEGIIKRTYDQLVESSQIQPQPETEVKTVPLDLDAAKKAGKVSPNLAISLKLLLTLLKPFIMALALTVLMIFAKSMPDGIGVAFLSFPFFSGSSLLLLNNPHYDRCCMLAPDFLGICESIRDWHTTTSCNVGAGANHNCVIHL